MAIEVIPDSPIVTMSPARISFSHDLSQNDAVEHHIRSTSSTVDFDFCVIRQISDQEYSSSSADELFLDGKILPIAIKKGLPPPPITAAPPPLPQPPPEIPEEKQSNKTSSFWGFKRSTSLNCGSDYAKKLCPLPLLSRSNSTGSTPAAAGGASSKRSPQISSNQKQNFVKCSAGTLNSSLKQSSSANHQKPPLKKSSYGSNYSNVGVKINPVLNVTPANLFGLGLLFSGGRERSKKR